MSRSWVALGSGPVGRKLLGVSFLCLLAFSGWLTHAIFTQKFEEVVPVTVRTSHVGLQMSLLADVKIRGVIVGEVREIAPAEQGKGALLELGMDPEKISAIPANVTAMILPKTLFGEKYVSLEVPSNPSAESLSANDVIEQSDVAIEVERVLSDLYPLLRAVQPSDLAATLNAVSTALEGRGERIGDNFVRLDGYLKKLNPQVPGLLENLRLLSQVSDNYAQVMPELGRFLRNQVVTGNTLVEKEEDLRALFGDVAAFSDTTRAFLEVNGDNIIRLGQVSTPTLALLEEFAPEYPCLIKGIVNQVPKSEEAYRNYTLHINLEPIPRQPTPYAPKDDPKYGRAHGVEEDPTCATLPTPPYSQANPAPMPPWADSRERDDGVAGTHNKYRPAPSYTRVTSGWAGTAAEQRVVGALAAPALGVPAEEVPDVATLLLGPIARGGEVSVR